MMDFSVKSTIQQEDEKNGMINLIARNRRRLREAASDTFALREKAARLNAHSSRGANELLVEKNHVFEDSLERMYPRTQSVMNYSPTKGPSDINKFCSIYLLDQYTRQGAVNLKRNARPRGYKSFMPNPARFSPSENDAVTCEFLLHEPFGRNNRRISDTNPFSNAFREIARELKGFTKLSPSKDSSETAILAQSAQKILNIIRTQNIKYPGFWAEMLSIGIFQSMIRTHDTEKIGMATEHLLAQQTYLTVEFHERMMEFSHTGKPNTIKFQSKNTKQQNGSVSLRIAEHLKSFLAESPNGNVESFLQSLCGTSDLRSRIDTYCNALLQKHGSSAMQAEWIRLFHTLRAGRLDAALLPNASFDGTHFITAHIEKLQNSFTVIKFTDGSEHVAELLKAELQKLSQRNEVDPFKIAVLLLLSQGHMSKDEVREALLCLRFSKAFADSDEQNFMWMALQFTDVVDPQYIARYFIQKHRGDDPFNGALAKADPFLKLTHESIDFLVIYRDCMYNFFQSSNLTDEAGIFALFFDFILHPGHKSQSFWRKHIASAMRHKEPHTQQKMNSDTEESIIVRGLKSVLTPLKSVFRCGGEPYQSDGDSWLSYCFEILNLFETQPRADFLIEMFLAQSKALFSEISLSPNADSGAEQMSLFKMILRGDNKSTQVPDQVYQEQLRFVDFISNQAKTKGFTSIYLYLCMDLFLYCIETEHIDDDMAQCVMPALISSLTKQICESDFQNANGLIDLATRLRENLVREAHRVSESTHKEYILFVIGLAVYQLIFKEVVPGRALSKGNSEETDPSTRGPLVILKSDIRLYIRASQASAIQTFLEKLCASFEVLVQEVEGVLSSGSSISDSTYTVIRKSTSLLLHLVETIQEESQSCLQLREILTNTFHQKFSEFVAWAQRFAQNAGDSTILLQTTELASEFLGPSCFL